MPIDGLPLVIEPTYPTAEALSSIGRRKVDHEDPNDGWRLVNGWYSHSRKCDVGIYEKDGRRTYGIRPAVHGIDHQLNTLGASDAWGLEQEYNALQLLGTLVSHRQMKHYVLTGTFIETSKRSGVTYFFRRLRPTVAVSAGNRTDDSLRILAALCMHPIAYYEGSWAGAMCPTDDVVAHLMLMRADEHMFWKRCNQHPAYRPEAGL